ncbi:MAG: YciI family protein [Nocardioidaceae bacterium]
MHAPPDQKGVTMRYMGFVKMDHTLGEPPQALIDAMGSHIEQSIADGTFVDGGGLYSETFRTEIRVRAGQVTSTDGPFAEAKEEVGGYSVLEFRDHAEAVEGARQLAELHRKHWPEWEGAIEVRRIAGPDDVGGQ